VSSQAGADLLYGLLPLIYRARDEQEAARRGEVSSVPGPSRGPLRQLLEIIGSEYDRLHADVHHLLENVFIETCDEWLIPYIGELVGIQVEEHAGPSLRIQRAQVANAILNRRRKGIPVTLERAIHETCGWSAHVIELYRYLARTRHLEYVGQEEAVRGRVVDVRIEERLRQEEGFSPDGHTVDVRRSAESGQLLFNADSVAVFLCRTVSFPVEHTQPFRVAKGCYTFDALGRDTPLFAAPPLLDPMTDPFEHGDLPLPLDPRALADDLEGIRRKGRADGRPARASRWVGRDRVVDLLLDGMRVLPEDVDVEELSHWHRPGPVRVGWLSPPLVEGLSDRIILSVRWGSSAPRDVVVEPGEDVAATAAMLEQALRAADPSRAFSQARVLTLGPRWLVLPGVPLAGEEVSLGFSRNDGDGLEEIGRTRDAGRRVSVLSSNVIEEGVRTDGMLRVRLGQGPWIRFEVPLGGRAEEIRTALHARLHHDHLHDWHVLVDSDRVLLLAEAPHPGDHLRAADVVHGRWAARRLGWRPRVAVDPRRGRLSLSLGLSPEQVRASWVFGRRAAVGATPYPRSLGSDEYLDPDNAVVYPRDVWRAHVCKAFRHGVPPSDETLHCFAELSEALAARPKAEDSEIRIQDSSTYHPDPALGSFFVDTESAAVTIAAAHGEVPTLAGALRVEGTASLLTLEGLQLEGPLVAETSVFVLQCTLAGGVERTGDSTAVELEFQRCLLGRLGLSEEGTWLSLSDCVVVGSEGRALGGPGAATDGPPTTFVRCTVLGPVRVRSLDAVNSVFEGDVSVRDVDEGGLRYCALPYTSHVPASQYCVQFALPGSPATGSRVPAPVFRSRALAQPDVGCLADDTPEAILAGAEDGGEMGAFHSLHPRRRRILLDQLLTEHLPAGMTAGVLLLD